MAGFTYFECGTCGKEFPHGSRARDNHCNATGHQAPDMECLTCPRWFRSHQARNQHMNDTNHWPIQCGVCSATFQTERDRTLHEHDDHLYCADCDRSFQNANNLRMVGQSMHVATILCRLLIAPSSALQHLNSGAHRGRVIDCPFCRRDFATAAGLTTHLETGACPNAPHLGRDQLYQLIRSRDPYGVISKNLIDYTASPTYEATDQAWTGYAWGCCFCDRTFSSRASLNQHLNSPIHQSNLYHCPKRDCRQNFKTLAGIINHLESEACGCTRFETVQNQIGDFVRTGRLLAL